MCGIAGILFRDATHPVESSRLARMGDAIAHRGPDAYGAWQGPGIGLAHRRLSIIDLASGAQPLGNEDGSIQVVFNGEIYNYRQLQDELQARGHQLRTNSDTETLVHLYEDYGDAVVEKLRGMFAFALWDQRRRRLLLARDRIGLKPLYYACDGQRLVFASEIKGILAAGGVDRAIDVGAVDDFLTWGFVPGEKSIFRAVRKLPAGCVANVRQDDLDVRPRRYWQLPESEDSTRSVADWCEALGDKFRETVAAHRIADVPVGAFLSGGLDSTAVVGAMAEAGGADLQTFSIGFRDERFSELPYARIAAQRWGTKHVERIAEPTADESLAALVRHYDEPFADPSALPTMLVAQVAREHVKAALSGDGGDEAFGGYARYAHDLREASWRSRLPAPVRRLVVGSLARYWPKADWLPRPLRLKTALTNLSLEAPAAYANTLSICRPTMRRALLQPDLRVELNGRAAEERISGPFAQYGSDPLRGMIGADVSVLLPDGFLTKVDRASMAVGLEVRPPLVDHELLELAWRVPSDLKIRDGQTKWIFKETCRRWVPSEIVSRPKQGFDVPIDDWLRGPLRPQLEEFVLTPGAAAETLIDRREAARLYELHCRRLGRLGGPLWSLLVLGRWLAEYGAATRELSPAPRPATTAVG